MASELHRRKEQLKQRLSRHLSASQESSLNIPPVTALRDVVKTGLLLKLSSRGRLYPRCWKKRLCVLTKTTLYIYKTEGDSGSEKPVGDIDLSVFTHCKETGPKEAKKTAHTFILFRNDAAEQEVSRHVFAAPSAAELNDWLRKLRSVARPGDQKLRHPEQTASDSEVASGWRTSSDRPGSCVDPVMVPLPTEAARRPRGRARQRPRATLRPGSAAVQQPPSESSSSQPCLLDWPERSSSSSRTSAGGGLSSAYEYSSSGESVSSLSSSRCSVVRRLNTTMPEIALPRRSASPLAAATTTSASDVRQQMTAGSRGFPALSKRGQQTRQQRGSLPSIIDHDAGEVPRFVSPVQDLERDVGVLSAGGTTSTGSSSLSNLTATLTREGQTVPAVLAGLAELKDGLRRVSARVDSVEAALEGSDAEMTSTRADIAAVQGNLASMQTLTTTLNNKMSLFSGMFRKVDEQLQEMWAEMETVNNNVHHVMHTALESQERNEQLFAQLAGLRGQLLASFPDQLAGGSLPRLARQRHSGSRHRRDRLDSERLCEIDDPALDEVALPLSAAVEMVALPSAEPAAEPGSVGGDEVEGSGRITASDGCLPP